MGRCIQYRYAWTDREYLKKTEISRLMNGMSYVSMSMHLYVSGQVYIYIYMCVMRAGKFVMNKLMNWCVGHCISLLDVPSPAYPHPFTRWTTWPQWPCYAGNIDRNSPSYKAKK